MASPLVMVYLVPAVPAKVYVPSEATTWFVPSTLTFLPEALVLPPNTRVMSPLVAGVTFISVALSILTQMSYVVPP